MYEHYVISIEIIWKIESRWMISIILACCGLFVLLYLKYSTTVTSHYNHMYQYIQCCMSKLLKQRSYLTFPHCGIYYALQHILLKEQSSKSTFVECISQSSLAYVQPGVYLVNLVKYPVVMSISTNLIICKYNPCFNIIMIAFMNVCTKIYLGFY